MSDLVADASAVMARINRETGMDTVITAMESADRVHISAVNLAEVTTKLAEKGLDQEDIERVVDRLDINVVPFDADAALATGMLRPLTRHAGLSLGDRACIALAIALGQPVLTADRAWADLDLPIDVILAR